MWLGLYSTKEIEIMEYIPLPPIKMETNTEKIIRIAEKYIGKDVSEEILGKDSVSDSVGCVETITLLLREVLLDFPVLTYTPTLVSQLKKDSRFAGTLELNVGNIIVNATGTGNGTLKGHAGLIWKDGKIISNNSFTGKLEINYTLESWKQRFRIRGGMPTQVYKFIN